MKNSKLDALCSYRHVASSPEKPCIVGMGLSAKDGSEEERLWVTDNTEREAECSISESQADMTAVGQPLQNSAKDNGEKIGLNA